MTLHDWRENRWLIEHVTSGEEIADLLAVVDRDLADAAIERLSPDRRLGVAYNAALQLATAALAASGYRPGRERAHERVILSLRYTVGLESEAIDLLDVVRRKCNVSNYERAGTTSSGEAEEVHELVIALDETVREWLKRHHPTLTGKD